MDHETFYVKVEWFLASYCVDTPENLAGDRHFKFQKKLVHFTPSKKSDQKTSFTHIFQPSSLTCLCPTTFLAKLLRWRWKLFWCHWGIHLASALQGPCDEVGQRGGTRWRRNAMAIPSLHVVCWDTCSWTCESKQSWESSLFKAGCVDGGILRKCWRWARDQAAHHLSARVGSYLREPGDDPVPSLLAAPMPVKAFVSFECLAGRKSSDGGQTVERGDGTKLWHLVGSKPSLERASEAFGVGLSPVEARMWRVSLYGCSPLPQQVSQSLSASERLT